mmetsp:Transcript_62306/g.103615  ORF Transcript_62306/g.103615 Transcript_62306/m.103615 type:complete len:97 (-) Transcript_62306:413-703(-)
MCAAASVFFIVCSFEPPPFTLLTAKFVLPIALKPLSRAQLYHYAPLSRPSSVLSAVDKNENQTRFFLIVSPLNSSSGAMMLSRCFHQKGYFALAIR